MKKEKTTAEIFRLRNRNLHLIPKGNEPIEVLTTIDNEDNAHFNKSFKQIQNDPNTEKLP